MAHNRKRRFHESSFSQDSGRFGVAETLSHLKKPRVSDESAQRHSATSTTPGQEVMSDHLNAQQGEWEIAESKSSRKRKKKQLEGYDKARPCLRFQNKSLRVKDLQDLVLYTLSDGIGPQWVAVREAKKVEQVVVIMVPGLDVNMLHTIASSVSHDSQDAGSPADGNLAPGANGSNDYEDDPQASRKARENCLLDSIVPVRAPGDSKYAKVHSPLQAMLISPTTDAKDKKPGRTNDGKSFQAVQTPIIKFISTADELREAEFPVHPSIFTSEIDGELEKNRREGAKQSSSTGWVDTDVSVSAPVLPKSSALKVDPVTQGLTVYAIDCEMVLTTDDIYSLARVSVLNWHGQVVLDKLVKPPLPVKNYFTQFSGITPEKLEHVTTTLPDVQGELHDLLTSSSILLGHSLESDLNALKLTHPFIVDTSMIYPHPRGLPLRSSLKFLANKYLKREIQMGGTNGHDSVEDARAVLDLVRQKCEKGPKWGTSEANGESIFRRLARSGRSTAIVEYGTPERGFGREATVAIGCQNDGEVANGLIRAIEGGVGCGKVRPNFIWGRLRDLETARGWNSNMDRYSRDDPSQTNGRSGEASGETGKVEKIIPPSPNGALDTDALDPANTSVLPQTTTPTIESATRQTVTHLTQVFHALAPGTIFILYSGTGDMRPVLRLQQMQQQYRKEFKVKKWDELSVKWTDDEEQALRRAVEEARDGWGFVCVK